MGNPNERALRVAESVARRNAELLERLRCLDGESEASDMGLTIQKKAQLRAAIRHGLALYSSLARDEADALSDALVDHLEPYVRAQPPRGRYVLSDEGAATLVEMLEDSEGEQDD